MIERVLTVPAGVPAGSSSATFTGLPAGSTCAVTETQDGDNGRVSVTATTIDPETVTVAEGQTSAVAVSNEYAVAFGGIALTKTISGEGAGIQGPIEVRIACTPPDGGDVIERSLSVPAQAPAGSRSETYGGLPAGSTCVVTEARNGDNDRVSVTTSIEPGTVTVVEDETTPVAVTNEFARAVGGLRVTKVIGGPAAGEQDEIVLQIDCDDEDGAFDQEFVIPAQSAAGGHSTTVADIPVGTTCIVTETASGETQTVVLSTPSTIEPGPVTITEDVVGEVTATNSYRFEDVSGDDDETDDVTGGGDYGDDFGGYLAGAGGPAGTPIGLALVLAATGAGLLAWRRRRMQRG